MKEIKGGKRYALEFVCSCCGRLVTDMEARDTEKWCDGGMCMECTYWTDLCHNPPSKYCVVIDGRLYHFPPARKTTKETLVAFTTNRKIISSNTAWNYGVVPKRFQPFFPTSAHMISQKEAEIMKRCPDYRCKKLGCWDRMQCFWFGEDEKNWNKIPKDHKIGDECCPLFINISRFL